MRVLQLVKFIFYSNDDAGRPNWHVHVVIRNVNDHTDHRLFDSRLDASVACMYVCNRRHWVRFIMIQIIGKAEVWLSFAESKLLFKWYRNFEKILEVPSRLIHKFKTTPPATEGTWRTPSQRGFCGCVLHSRCSLSAVPRSWLWLLWTTALYSPIH
jgi:hypothetical protein